MKNLLVPTFLALAAALLAPTDRAAAQSSFNSSAMPNANPFSRGGSGIPPAAAAPAVPAAGAVPLGQPAYGGYPGYPAPAAGPIDPNHRLGQGDLLSYYVAEDRDDPSRRIPLAVTVSGDVNVPLLGNVKAAGKTAQELAGDIKGQLERRYYWPGHATVVMGLTTVAPKVSRGRVYVKGYVKTQGPIDLPPDGSLTVSQAIAAAGGFQEFGSQLVRVIRKGGPAKGISVNVADINKGVNVDQDLVLEPGDSIVVKAKLLNLGI